MVPRLRFFVREALTGLWRSKGVAALSIVTIGVALGLLATFGVVLLNLSRVADELGHEVGISAYLAGGTTEQAGLQLTDQARSWPGVTDAQFMTSTAAMAWLRTNLGEDALVLDGVPTDVLPPSVEISLEARSWTRPEVDALASRLRALDGVVEVRYGQEDIERVYALLGFARVTATVIGLVLCLAAVMIVSNTIRLAVYARRDQIEIMTLIGATAAFVRTPFVIEGAIQGLFGGALALFGLVALREALTEGLEAGLSYAYGPIELVFLPAQILVGLLIVGMLLGLVGSTFAVGRFIRI